MEESSDPLTFGRKEKQSYEKLPVLEKRPSNPFDVSAGENRRIEDEASSELTALSDDSVDPIATAVEHQRGRGGARLSVPRNHTDRTPRKEDEQACHEVRELVEIDHEPETVEYDQTPEGLEEQYDGDVTIEADEGMRWEDVTLRQPQTDEMMLDEGVYYERLWPPGGEEALEQEQETDGKNGYDIEEARSFETEALEDDEGHLEAVDISDGEFEAHTSDDEVAFELKNLDEQQEIHEEMEELMEKIPELEKDYKLIDRLGTGTFSSVYKAIDLNYSDWDNRLWQVSHPRSTSTTYQHPRHPEDDPTEAVDSVEKKPTFVAIKRIVATSSPRRIINEILIMELCRGCRHVAQIITVHRVEDQIVVVMPYQRSSDLRDLVRDLSIRGIRQYFRCLFRALRDIHSRNIIHRDLKPGNFLFDSITWTGTMVDFGLAEMFDYWEEKDKDSGGCLHTGATFDAPHGVLKEGPKWTQMMRKSLKVSKEKSEAQSENVGWPTEDTRPVIKANRAGTRGFRAPEVLLKCTAQTPVRDCSVIVRRTQYAQILQLAVDIWSAGTMLLFFLSKKWPIFTATSDMHALVEQALIIGKETMEQCAALHGRTFSTNIPEIRHRTPWTRLVKTLNPDTFNHDPSLPSLPETQETSDEHETRDLLAAALDLLEKCLEPISVRRITARDALYHRFLAPDQQEIAYAEESAVEGGDPIILDEDECFPHPAGEGTCREYHTQDPETGDWKVFVGVGEHGEDEWHTIEAGEGQAIGSRPCEFHIDFDNE